MKAVREQIALVAPPLTISNSPYISIPVLMGWLEENGIPCTFFDLSREIVSLLLSDKERIRHGYKYICDSFLELNGKTALNPLQANQIGQWQMLLHRLATSIDFLEGRTQSLEIDIDNTEVLLELVTAPYWPNSLLAARELQFRSKYNLFSSHDLTLAAEENFFFTPLLEKIIAQHFSNTNIAIVGLSIVFDQQIIPAMQCGKILKKLDPDIHITLGGPFTTVHMRELKNPEFFDVIDSVVLDEGEVPLLELYSQVRKDKADFSKVSNLIWRNERGEVVRNNTSPYIPLDRMPAPAYDKCQLEKYQDIETMRLSFRLSKGCYWKKCSFCRTNLSLCNNYNQPKVDYIYDRLCEVIDRTGIKTYLFSDESSAPWVLEQLSELLLRDNRKIDWVFHTRVDSKALSRTRVELFEKAGCSGFTVGIECLNDRLLQLMNKGISVEEVDRLLHQLKSTLPIGAYMMVGLPTETKDEFYDSWRAIEGYRKQGLLARYTYSMFYLSPGSLMWDEPEKYGIENIRPVGGEKGLDLMPNNVTCYESSGMSRYEACRHYFLYRHRNRPPRLHDHPFSIQNEKYFSRYDVQRIVKNLGEHFISQFDTPFGKWLEAIAECPCLEGEDPWWERLCG
ncbi:B12-binding domain-containing radical SAM protein [Desulforhopalus sp. 52FAK]